MVDNPTMTDTPAPTTQDGRALLDLVTDFWPRHAMQVREHILAIEDEAHTSPAEALTCAACGRPPRPSLVTVENALDEAWLESHDARSIARPPDLAEHLHEALLDYIAVEESEQEADP